MGKGFNFHVKFVIINKYISGLNALKFLKTKIEFCKSYSVQLELSFCGTSFCTDEPQCYHNKLLPWGNHSLHACYCKSCEYSIYDRQSPNLRNEAHDFRFFKAFVAYPTHIISISDKCKLLVMMSKDHFNFYPNIYGHLSWRSWL